ncbi:FAD-binding oxidoreductase [Stackebrandtia nassauensis]|uniref:FAD linked oxidase domain protein n=1 Tax=Stackebrandtia nassauensis (strain DSM 44728 / CIP 108903 / NRRL B-16338 / NBRC 102104 / LLR-40K-21) TaxID=446470 RepID=D3PUJ2_STANL|nr:FAD-binding oxidoreductase [Stackebrandtia nassauensis]ADD43005.1 FAD linked oxidase domain protein [Stackebrandtia nassauensis DSM 44728]
MTNSTRTELSDGDLIKPGDAAYDEARTVWNAMVDRRPRAIVRCRDAAEVAAAVRYAREHDLEIGVRCGGHSIVGHAVPDGGLMIDLRSMSAVSVDPSRRIAHVQGGAMLGALDAAAQRHGLATTAGNVSHTGVGGLTLGGGMGWLARKYGLTCDNVESYELVTATGALIRASRDENPELFWGLRGGGGNFGIVTRFEFRLHPVGTRALLADFTFPLSSAGRVLRAWRDLSLDAPREATFTAAVADSADGPRVTAGLVWVGDPDRARGFLPTMRALGKPSSHRVEELSYLRLQSMDDSVEGHAVRRYWKGHYFADFTDAAVEALWRRGTQDGHGQHLPSVSLQSYGGAIADVADADSAFSHRDARFEFVGASRWLDPSEDTSRIAAARRCGAALDQFASGAYVNTLGDDGAAGVRRAFPADKLARLTALKDTYDPDNVFHLNQNIRPSN